MLPAPHESRQLAIRCLRHAALVWGLFCLAGATRAAPLTLDEAIQRALAKNYTLKTESYSPQIARANVRTAVGRFDPEFQASDNYNEDGNPQPSDPFSGTRPPSSLVKTHTYDASIAGVSPWGLNYRLTASTQNRRGTFNGFLDQYYSFGGIVVTQPILRDFGFNPNLSLVRIARLDLSRSEWDYRQAAINTIAAVIFRFNDLHVAGKNLETARRSRDLAAQLLSENERRFRVGSMSEYDVTSARSGVARREEAILIAEQAVRENENFLRELISDDRSFALLGGSLEIEAPAPAPRIVVDAARDFPQALEKRPDYQQSRLAVKRAEISRDYQRNQRLPRVELVGSLGYNGLDSTFRESRRQVDSRENHSYSAGVVVGIPFTFAKERARYRAAELTARQVESRLAALEQSIVVDVGNAAGQIETTQKRVAAARVAREFAQLTLEAEVKRLRVGTGSSFVVLQLQESLAQIEIREYLAQSDARKAIAEYDRQLGRTLESHHVTIE